jgi:lipopolysaccharide exporter
VSDATGSRIRSSVKITFAATILSGLVQALAMVVLARLLGPSDYGYYAVSLSISGVTVGFLASALERAMIVEPDVESLRGRSLVVTALLSAVAAITIGVCGGIAYFTGWKIKFDVLAIICVTQALASIAIVPRAFLRRGFSFGRIAGGELAGLILGGGLAAILFAALHYGPYSLAIGYVVSNIVSASFVLWKSPSGMMRLKLRDMGHLLQTATGMVKVAGLEAVHGQLSPIVLSAALGPAPLGLFNRVYSIITLPVQLLTSSMGRVMVSGMVAVADDLARLKRASGMLLRVASAVMTPLAFGIAGSNEAFTGTVLGPKWLVAAPLIPIMAVTVWCNMIGSLFGVLAESVRLFNDKLRIQAMSTAVLIACLLGGSIWGLVGVAAGSALASVFFFVMYARLTLRILEMHWPELLRWLAPGWLAGAACFGVTSLLQLGLGGRPYPLVLATQIAACGISTLICYVIVDRKLLSELSRAILPGKVGHIVDRTLARFDAR